MWLAFLCTPLGRAGFADASDEAGSLAMKFIKRVKELLGRAVTFTVRMVKKIVRRVGSVVASATHAVAAAAVATGSVVTETTRVVATAVVGVARKVRRGAVALRNALVTGTVSVGLGVLWALGTLVIRFTWAHAAHGKVIAGLYTLNAILAAVMGDWTTAMGAIFAAGMALRIQKEMRAILREEEAEAAAVVGAYEARVEAERVAACEEQSPALESLDPYEAALASEHESIARTLHAETITSPAYVASTGNTLTATWRAAREQAAAANRRSAEEALDAKHIAHQVYAEALTYQDAAYAVYSKKLACCPACSTTMAPALHTLLQGDVKVPVDRLAAVCADCFRLAVGVASWVAIGDDPLVCVTWVDMAGHDDRGHLGATLTTSVADQQLTIGRINFVLPTVAGAIAHLDILWGTQQRTVPVPRRTEACFRQAWRAALEVVEDLYRSTFDIAVEQIQRSVFETQHAAM